MTYNGRLLIAATFEDVGAPFPRSFSEFANWKKPSGCRIWKVPFSKKHAKLCGTLILHNSANSSYKSLRDKLITQVRSIEENSPLNNIDDANNLRRKLVGYSDTVRKPFRDKMITSVNSSFLYYYSYALISIIASWLLIVRSLFRMTIRYVFSDEKYFITDRNLNINKLELIKDVTKKSGGFEQDVFDLPAVQFNHEGLKPFQYGDAVPYEKWKMIISRLWLNKYFGYELKVGDLLGGDDGLVRRYIQIQITDSPIAINMRNIVSISGNVKFKRKIQLNANSFILGKYLHSLFSGNGSVIIAVDGTLENTLDAPISKGFFRGDLVAFDNDNNFHIKANNKYFQPFFSGIKIQGEMNKNVVLERRKSLAEVIKSSLINLQN